MDALALIACFVVGLAATPFGLLPSVLLFRDVANGTDTSAGRKMAYGWCVWIGLAVSWALAIVALYAVYRVLTG